MENTTRREHIDWCKKRALAYLDHSPPDPIGALGSMTMDLTKHPETSKPPYDTLSQLGMFELMSPAPVANVRHWIEGF